MKRMSWLLVLLGGLAGVGALGCAEDVRVGDDLDFSLFEYRLHTPYVVGVEVTIRVSREGQDSVEGWWGESENPEILRVGENSGYPDTLWIDCTAAGPGTTELRIRDRNGSIRARRTIRVERPSDLVLVPAGLQRILHDEVPGLDTGELVLILQGGTATFEVEYYRDGERLFGNGVLQIAPGVPGLEAENVRTYLFRNREWLVLSPLKPGPNGVTLSVGDRVLEDVRIEAVGLEAITDVRIEAEETRGAKDGTFLYLLARAFDETGREIYGVDFDWDVDGMAEPGEGDLFGYEYQDEAYAEVTARAGSASDQMLIEMSGGTVTSSNSVGCSTSPAGSSFGIFLAMLLGFGVWLMRRRPARCCYSYSSGQCSPSKGQYSLESSSIPASAISRSRDSG